MRFEVLGPLVVTGPAGWVALPAGPSSAAVCWLVAHAGRQVTHASLAAVSWPDGEPGSVSALLRGLRPRLGEALETSSAHAVLHAAGEDVDAVRFAELLGHATAYSSQKDHEAMRAPLEEALGLWRGEPYREMAGALAAQPVISRLTSLRAAAVEDLFGLRLRGPVDYRLVADLRAESTRTPDRPRLRRQLAHALYRTGRQVEALGLLAALRAEADDQAKAVYDAVLRHDDALDHGELELGETS